MLLLLTVLEKVNDISRSGFNDDALCSLLTALAYYVKLSRTCMSYASKHLKNAIKPSANKTFNEFLLTVSIR